MITPNVWKCLALGLVAVVLYGGLYLGIRQDKINADARQEEADRVGCLGKYETPECLGPRLKKAELKRQYEEAANAIDQQGLHNSN
ncbi:hypothetical protein D3C79_49320 [compost metagenome]